MRVAAAADGTLRVGRTAAGRGAWCCSTACFDAATTGKRRGALARALRRSLTTAEITTLRARLSG